MTQLDKRFALVRDGQPWYVARVAERGSSVATYRISERRKSRDAHREAEQLTDLVLVARRVLKEGKRMRCAPEGGAANSLDLESRGVTGYRLDAALASLLGVPAKDDGR